MADEKKLKLVMIAKEIPGRGFSVVDWVRGPGSEMNPKRYNTNEGAVAAAEDEARWIDNKDGRTVIYEGGHRPIRTNL